MESVEERCARHPNFSLVIAPVACAPTAGLAARIFSKVFPKQDSSEIGWTFLGIEASVRSGFRMGTHLAIFHAAGKIPQYNRWENRFGGSSGRTLMMATTIS